MHSAAGTNGRGKAKMAKQRKPVDSKSPSNSQILVAFISFLGVALTAVLANWERINPKPAVVEVPEPQFVVGKASVELHLDAQPIELGATLNATLKTDDPPVGVLSQVAVLVNGKICTEATNYRNPQQSGVLTTTASCSIRIPAGQPRNYAAVAPNQSHDQESLSLEIKYHR
jgi:hypothetical protein